MLSFVVIGRFWIAHHRLFRLIRSYDLGLLWLNLFHLLGICVLPFPTELLGATSAPMSPATCTGER